MAAYNGAAQLSYALEFAGPVASIVWLPVGVGIAFLYFGGLGLAPGVLVGDLLANDYSTLPVGSALGQTFGNVLEVVIAVVLLRRLARRGSPLDSLAGVVGMLVAISAGTAFSATVGTLSLWLGGVLDGASVPSVWRTWWLGDLAGALVVVPLALAWYRSPIRRLTRRRLLEGGALFAGVVAISDVASRTTDPLVYIVFPFLIWAALRFGRRGATLAVAITVVFTLWNTTHYLGPFTVPPLSRGVLDTQLFVGVAALSTLVLAAMVSERERFVRELAASRGRLIEAAHAERRRIEHNLHDGAQQRLIWLAGELRRAVSLTREHPDRAPDVLETAEAEVTTALEELRDLAHGIHPAVLTALGLRAALTEMAIRAPLRVAIGELPSARVDERAEATAYYVFAEAITNAQKHSHASSVRVSGTVVDGTLRIEIADDGVGGASPRGAGLIGLRDRVEGVGGGFALASPPGRGTRITATIPLATPAA